MLEARWQDFSNGVWVIKQSRQSPNTGRYTNYQATVISRRGHDQLNEMLQYSNGSDFLFPQLIAMKKVDRDTQISAAIKAIWWEYLLEIDGFRCFFGEMAERLGVFQPKFIHSIMNGKLSTFLEPNLSLSRTLVDWWGDELMRYSVRIPQLSQVIHQL